MAPFHSLGQDDRNEVQNDFFGHVTTLALTLGKHDAKDIVNDTTPYIKTIIKMCYAIIELTLIGLKQPK